MLSQTESRDESTRLASLWGSSLVGPDYCIMPRVNARANALAGLGVDPLPHRTALVKSGKYDVRTSHDEFSLHSVHDGLEKIGFSD